jgi:hypothetical protein
MKPVDILNSSCLGLAWNISDVLKILYLSERGPYSRFVCNQGCFEEEKNQNY